MSPEIRNISRFFGSVIKIHSGKLGTPQIKFRHSNKSLSNEFYLDSLSQEIITNDKIIPVLRGSTTNDQGRKLKLELGYKRSFYGYYLYGFEKLYKLDDLAGVIQGISEINGHFLEMKHLAKHFVTDDVLETFMERIKNDTNYPAQCIHVAHGFMFDHTMDLGGERGNFWYIYNSLNMAQNAFNTSYSYQQKSEYNRQILKLIHLYISVYGIQTR